MLPMKRLDAFFSQKSELLRDKETYKGLLKYAECDVCGDLDDALRSMESAIGQREEELSDEENAIKEILSSVEDLTMRSILILRFVEAQPWKIIGAVFGISGHAASDRTYKFIRKIQGGAQNDAE